MTEQKKRKQISYRPADALYKKGENTRWHLHLTWQALIDAALEEFLAKHEEKGS